MSVSSEQRGPSTSTPRSLAAILEGQQIEPPILAFCNESSPRDFLGRVVENNYSFPGEARSSSQFPAPPRSSSSMALSARSYTIAPASTIGSDAYLSSLPSLGGTSLNTCTDSNVGTSLASVVQGLPLLQQDEVDGPLQLPDNSHRPPPTYACTFYFLRCGYFSSDEEEWKTHCLSHFRGQTPPKTVSCSLCDEFKGTYPNPFEGWEARMNHVAQHMRVGHSVDDSQPDYHLFTHLWQKRIIDGAQYQQLKSGGSLSRFTLIGGAAGDDRRVRRDRRDRRY